MENLEKRSGATDASINSRLQEIKERITGVKDILEDNDTVVKESTNHKRLHFYYIYAGVIVLANTHIFVGGSVSGSIQGSELVDPFGLFCGVLVLFRSFSPPNSYTRLPELLLIYGYESLYLFSFGAGWSLSEDNYARVLSEIRTPYH